MTLCYIIDCYKDTIEEGNHDDILQNLILQNKHIIDDDKELYLQKLEEILQLTNHKLFKSLINPILMPCLTMLLNMTQNNTASQVNIK